ncbi:two-component sensor histidine kinase [Kribbella sp. VKM Ac-2571]|uniref:sensor histidine kinase n=1 Tax=Kribbella sp. VKM Ac-2571 TaxID=2512222 RepID=UPI0010E2635A|nr:PAS domain-containing sensor histidine kinase [Kribbella sp. VKM Ac-2571]TDO63921.1 two-component sensor histidine kinase [Kribbella sp. VKM Ac-2571]
MPSLSDVARNHTTLDQADLDRLQLLVSDWQMLADLSFADLVLWLPDTEGLGFWAGAQMRPTTGPTAYLDDIVGSFIPRGRRHLLDQAYDGGRICREGDPEWRDDVPVRVETIPVRRGSRVIAVIARNTNLLGVRTPSRLEIAYLQSATDLARMITDGIFPYGGERLLSTTPRVGDGCIRVDRHGMVTFASPNALSAYRRMGLVTDLVGSRLKDVTADLLQSGHKVDDVLASVVTGRAAKEIEIENSDATLFLRAIPLRADGQHVGALILLRDVTELRSRERELVTKEATIREIHHRVKNNLQTVAALLRMQARRITVPEGQAALAEAVRRVGSIAIVHETLSESFDEHVDFDDVADRVAAMVADVSTVATVVETRRSGSFGVLDSEIATPLAMVLTELMQNSVEHAFGARDGGAASGTIELTAERSVGRLHVDVIDDGSGLPANFDSELSGNLGLSIVRTLVIGELDGTLVFGNRHDGHPGAQVTLDIPVKD